jgi:Domain of unknown function (DUF6321)
MRASEIINETKRKSAAVKLQGAWERQQAKSTASRKRGEEYMAKIKQDVADKAKKEKDVEEDWNKVNRHDKTNGLSQKAVNAYRRENPGSKLKTAVTTKPSKLKAGSKAAKRRKSFCARMGGNKGPMKKPNGKPTPKALALRRWNCESIEEMQQLIMLGEQYIANMKEGGEKYKIKSVGAEGGKDYYISPSTGKKVYKKAKVGDHENPNSGEHKPKVRMPYKEDGSAGGTSSGSIASVSMPLGGKKKKKGGGVNLLGGPVFKR